MRILLTNNTLGALQGTELYLYDVALELQRRGHTPIAFSTCLGEVARKLQAATVPVIDNLAECGEPPDIIHGQHHYETLTAALHFPDVPVINFCHGWTPVEEEPLIFPRVLRYVAVDETCRDRLVYNFGIEPSRLTVLFNFVDTGRFKLRAHLSSKPRRALAFGNYFAKGGALNAIEQACGEAGIELDVVGWGSNHAIADPENVLPAYDIVFAKARAALEAMAVGAAVVLTGATGFGPMVTSRNWSQLRRMNFGVRALALPLSKETIVEQTNCYDPVDASAVCALVREQARLTETVDRLLDLYEQVIAENRDVRVAEFACQIAAARHLNRYGATFKAFQHEHSRDRSEPFHHAFEALFKKVIITAGTLGVDVAGSLDSVVRRYGIVKVTGWACDARSKKPAAAVIFLQNSQCVGVGFPDIPRPDAATWLGAHEDRFGFDTQFEAADSSIQVVALMSTGEVFDISAFTEPEPSRILKGLLPPDRSPYRM